MESVPIYRGSNVPITNLLSALGDIKETRLTATLAYLIADDPEQFKELLDIEKRDKILNVQVEYQSEGNRYDIRVNTKDKIVVVEAKLGFKQNKRQVKSYLRQLKKERRRISLILLDTGSFYSSSFKSNMPKNLLSKITYKEWNDVYSVLKRIRKSRKKSKEHPSTWFLSGEMMNYLEVGGMVSEERKEVYSRDLSGESMMLFFKHHIYKSDSKVIRSAKGNLYFAPYFTRHAVWDAEEYGLDVGEGISYIAPIIDFQVLNRNEIKEYLISQKHQNAKEAAKMVLSQTRRREIMLLRLGKPVKLFLTPITKPKLGSGLGAMGSKSFTFANLLVAASKG